MSATILVVEDEPAIQSLIEVNLRRAGHEVQLAADAETARRLVQQALPDLVLLDWMLPGMSGIDFARLLRSEARTRSLPIIMLTARAEERDKVEGLEIGADDYVTKPFSPRELLARVRALLKRARGEEGARPRFRFGDVELDLDGHRVYRGGEEVVLAPQEFRLLAFLATHPNRVYSREQLLTRAWDPEVYVEPRTVDVHIRRLRARIEADPTHPRHIETVRGTGYRFNPSASA